MDYLADPANVKNMKAMDVLKAWTKLTKDKKLFINIFSVILLLINL